MAQFGTITFKTASGKTKTFDLDKAFNGTVNPELIRGRMGTQAFNKYAGLPPDLGLDPRADYEFARGFNTKMLSPEDAKKVEMYIGAMQSVTSGANSIFNQIKSKYGQNNLGKSEAIAEMKSRFQKEVLDPKNIQFAAEQGVGGQSKLDQSIYQGQLKRYQTSQDAKNLDWAAYKQKYPSATIQQYNTNRSSIMSAPTAPTGPSTADTAQANSMLSQYQSNPDYRDIRNNATALYNQARLSNPNLSWEEFTGRVSRVERMPTIETSSMDSQKSTDAQSMDWATWNKKYGGTLADYRTARTTTTGGATGTGDTTNISTTNNTSSTSTDFMTQIRNMFSGQSADLDKMAQLIADSIGKLTPEVQQVTKEDLDRIASAVESEFGQYFVDMKNRAETDYDMAQRFAKENLSKLFGQTEEDVNTSKKRIERNYSQAVTETQAALANRGLTRGGARGKAEENLAYQKAATTSDLEKGARRSLESGQQTFERQWGTQNKPSLLLQDQMINPLLALNEPGTEVIKQQRSLADLQRERDTTLESERRSRQQQAFQYLNPSYFG